MRAAADKSGATFLFGGGEMVERIRNFDWANTPVGPVETWPQALKSALGIIMGSRYQMFVWWGPEHINFYNDAYRSVLGNRHPNALGRRASEVWSDIWDTVGPQAHQVLYENVSTWHDNQLLVMERNGYPEETFFSYSYSPLPSDTGGVGGVFCVCTETTERVIGERRLAALRQLASATASAKSPDQTCELAAQVLREYDRDVSFALLYLMDAEGEQARLVARTGIAGGLPVVPGMVNFKDARGLAGQFWPFREALAGDKLKLTDLSAREPLPGGPWPEPTSTAMLLPLKGSQEQPIGFVILGASPRRAFDDKYEGFFELIAGNLTSAITNARAYDEERRRAEELAKLDRAKTTFLSNVSHELRTPLTLMLGPLEESRSYQGGVLPKEITHNLDVAHRNSLRLLKLVNTLLDFARIEAGRIEANYEPTDLADYTTELASVFRSAIEKAGVRLVVDCPPLPELVFVDREMWEKVMLNLLSNAFKFTFHGEIKVALNWCGERVELTVTDTGVGIPETDLPRMFERFHRVRGAKSRTHEGTGIGLALVQELAHLHGGEVKVRSQEGRGSEFIVSIQTGKSHLPPDHIRSPRLLDPMGAKTKFFVEEALRLLPTEPRKAEAPEETFPQSRRDAKTPRARVLLADDNADMREYVQRLLAENFDVEAVPDGEAALESVRARQPDLVLADVMMPRLDGFGLLRQLRHDERTRTIPMIILSARAGEESRLEGLDAGADDYLIKPFSARELVARVQSQLELARLRREGHERIKHILDSITDGFHVVDAQGRMIELNAAARKTFVDQGVEVDTIVGRHVFDVFPAARDGAAGDALIRSLEHGESIDAEVFYEPWNRWYYIRTRPLPEGGVATFFHDITERKQAEIALRESEKHLELVSNTVPTLISYIDKDFRYRSCNSAYTNWFGVPSEKILGRSVREVVGEEIWKSIQPRLENALTGRTVEFETEAKYHLGGTRWIHAVYTPHRDSEGRVLGIVALITDITQRKHDYDGLQRLHGLASRFVTEGNFKALLDEIVDAAIAVTHAEKGTIQLFNPASGTLEIAASRGFSKSWLAYFNQVRAEQGSSCGTAAHLRKRVVVEDVTTSDNFLNSPALGVQLAENVRAVQSTPLIGRAGDLLGVVSTHFTSPYRPTERELHWLDLLARQAADLIERSRSEEALRQAQAELRQHANTLESAVADRTARLQETVTELESFSYSIAHDMRAPLRSMRGFAGIINADFADRLDPDTKDYLRRISASAERLDRLIEDVLNYSKVVRGSIPLEPVQTEKLVREIIESYPDFQPPLATVLVQTPLYNVRANPAALTQIISNLLSNAAKFVAPGVIPRIVIRSERTNDAVRLWFEDNGIGIPAHGVERIFKMFQRLHPAGTYEGTGIGLTIIRKAADRMGGRVGVESEPGKGSRFWVELPKA